MVRNPVHKWWFWVIVTLVLAYPVWYGYHWAKYYVYMYRTYGPAAEGARQYMKSVEQYEEDMRNDQYGGVAPEETLRLFVEALESKDYELATKYYHIEKQAEVSEKMPLGVQSGSFEGIISAYRNGSVISTPYESQVDYEIELFPKGEDIPYGFIFRFNHFTQKWKIVE